MENRNLTKIITANISEFFGKESIEEIQNMFTDASENITVSDERISNELNSETINSFAVRDKLYLLVSYAEKKLTPEKYLLFMVKLGQNAMTLGEFSAAVDIHKMIINNCGSNKDLASFKASAYVGLAEIYSRQAEWENCRRFIKNAENIFKSIKDFKGAAKCQNLLGTIEGDCGKIAKAKKHFENSLNYLENDPDKALKGMIEINLGIICNIQGSFDEAIGFYKRALIDFQKINDIKRIAEIKHNMGMTYLRKKQYEAALAEFDQSISASLKTQYLQTLGITYLSKADAYTRLGDYKLAAAFANKAMEICCRTNDRLSIADIYKIKGIIQKKLGKMRVAENYFLTSLKLNKELGNLMNEAETAYELGILYDEMKNKKESSAQMEKALKYYKKINAEKEAEDIKSYLPS